MKYAPPAALRNREPIAAALAELLPATGLVLEVASGSGVHAAHCAERFPNLAWQPSDVDEGSLASIRAWREQAGSNLLEPVRLDVRSPPWPVSSANAIFTANMLHISEYPACPEGLFAGAGQLLAASERVMIYGPFFRTGKDTAESNVAFDRSLRDRDPGWGIRQLDEVSAMAERHGFTPERVVEMPANNVIAVWRRLPAPGEGRGVERKL